MNIQETLEKISSTFSENSIPYALAGGIVANAYRPEIRFTQDLDFAVAIKLEKIEKAKKILEKINFEVGMARAGDLNKTPFRRRRKKTDIQMLIGRNPNDPDQIGVDLIILTMPWVKNAIIRAESNMLKIFEKAYPAITVEDFILSKLYTLSNQNRYKDLDDLEQILGNNPKLDLTYLTGQMSILKLAIPKSLRQKIEIDHELGKISREIERKN